MTLRVKTSLIVGASLAAMLVALFLVLRPLVIGEFARAERLMTIGQMTRAKATLENSIEEFAASQRPWVTTSDTYRFASEGNQSYVSQRLDSSVLLASRLNFVAVVASDGEVRYSTMFDDDIRQEAEVPPELAERLSLSNALVSRALAGREDSGLVLLRNGVMMVAALPITNSSQTLPVRGVMLFGRYIESGEWDAVVGAKGLEAKFISISGTAAGEYHGVSSRLLDKPQQNIAQREGNQMSGYALVRDFYDRPAGLLQISSPLESIHRANTTLAYLAGLMALCGLLFLLLSLWPIERLVLARLSRLNSLVDDIRSGSNLGRRVDEGGTDELSQLAFNINRTFSTLQTVAARQKRSERLYRQMAETALSAGDAYFVWQAGEEYLDWHGDIDALLGYPPGGMKRTQKAWLQHIHFVDQGKVVRSCARALALGQPVEIEFRVIRCDGTTRYWMIRGRPLVPENVHVPGKGDVTGMPRLLAVCIDITARKQSEEALRQSEERLQRIFDTAADAIVIADREGQITYANEAAGRIFGLLLEEITARTIDDPEWNYTDLDGGVFDTSQNPFHRVRATGERVYEAQYGVGTPDGNKVIVSVNAAPLLDARGNFSGMVASFADVTERRTLEDRLKYQAFHDSLTGLANRSLFRDRLEHALMRRDKAAVPVAVLFIDLDNFKYINDSLGHAVGDELIIEISSRLRLSLRAGDTAARFGGDEFVVLLELSDSPHYAIQVAERLLENLREPFFLSGREVFTTPSIGITFSSGGYDHPDEMLRHADAAMYEAKRRGKARYEVFESSMSASAIHRLEIENDLRRALQKGEFLLHYQPKWDLESDSISGFEALVRWMHPQRGLVPPNEFIPIAEETGLIVPLGFEVLKTACQQAKIWSSCISRPLTMSVNVSARQLQLPEIVPLVAQVLQETECSPSSLILEITESSIMERTGDMLDTLNALKSLGIRLAIDDFGTGYSSLAYLRSFPFDYLKIDRQFVTNLHEEGGNGVIVSSMITLAHALNLLVIAEGTEMPEEVAHLKKLHCDMAQGYYFGRPLTAADMELKLGFQVGGVITAETRA